ncbi:MAG: hypothetical protein AMXMBFR16_12800 [Candidatus Uhrbacteria bacterium]
MGKPGPSQMAFELKRAICEGSSHPEYIGMRKRTGRTETSKYPEEKKSTEIPKVVASEIGTACTI